MERKTITQLHGLILVWFVHLFLGWGGGVAHAWLWSDPLLVTINDQQFRVGDYQDWWHHWQEEGMDIPTSPDEFIHWQLMAHEGARMELDTNPDFLRKVDTFVKVRSLMMLKSEEIDGKINIGHDELWAMYQKKYTPRLQGRLFFFHDAELANQQAAAINSKSLTSQQLHELAPADGGAAMVEDKWLRFPQLKGEWLTALNEAQPGEVRGPIVMDKGALLIDVLAVDDGSQDDFIAVRDAIKGKIREQQEGELTMQLVETLKKKFALQVDDEVLALVGESPLVAENKNKVLVSSNQGLITAGDFQAMLARERDFRRKYKFQKEEGDALQARVLSSMIAQTLISWEARDRHYENVSPLREMVAFYRRHRLVREVESRLLKPAGQLGPDEVKEYFLANQQRYTNPETVSIVLVEGEEELVQMIEQEVQQGRDFFEVVERHFPQGVPVQQLPVNHFSPEVRVVVESLPEGGISSPFKMGQNFGLLKLMNRRQKTAIPFTQVQDEISQKLALEKSEKARSDFLNRLKEHSIIKVHEGNWQKMLKELAAQDE